MALDFDATTAPTCDSVFLGDKFCLTQVIQPTVALRNSTLVCLNTQSGSTMLPPLTIRNLTAMPVKLESIGRSDTLAAADTTIASFLAHATGNLLQQITGKTHLKKAESETQSFEVQESAYPASFDILCEPFTTRHTNINLDEQPDRSSLRLNFSALTGQKYCIDISRTSIGTQVLATDDPQLDRHITGVFVIEKSWLTLYSSAGLHNWMRQLHDTTPLSALSIPGTHNSPAYHRALPSVRCQAVSPLEQLENGVRFFDVRVQQDSTSLSRLSLVHGMFPISLGGVKTFGDDFLPSVYGFLKRNPSETLIMSIKREGAGNGLTDEDLSKILFEKYCNSLDNGQYWYTDPRIPTLGQARGRIIVMRRFKLHRDVKKAGKEQFGEHEGIGEWAIDASSWADNTPYDLQRQICVQDFYEVSETQTIKKKLEYICAQLSRSSNVFSPHQVPFHLNFLTASNFFNPQCWPERIAAKINPAVTDYLALSHGRELDEGHDVDASTGIVVTDWCGMNGNWDLIHSIVGYNIRLWHKQNK